MPNPMNSAIELLPRLIRRTFPVVWHPQSFATIRILFSFSFYYREICEKKVLECSSYRGEPEGGKPTLLIALSRRQGTVVFPNDLSFEDTRVAAAWLDKPCLRAKRRAPHSFSARPWYFVVFRQFKFGSVFPTLVISGKKNGGAERGSTT